MRYQEDPEQVRGQVLKSRIEWFKKEFGDNVTLFSLSSNVDQKEAITLYENFDSFLAAVEDYCSSETTQEPLCILTEAIHYFNIALQILPALSGKAGKFLDFLEKLLGGGGPPWRHDWISYSLQFGLPSGISLSLHFNE